MELRKIMFSLAEVQSAVSAFCRAKGMMIVEADISHLTVSEDPRRTVVLHWRGKSEQDTPGKEALHREDVAEALIQYCLRHRVPLPRAGKKVLWPQEEGISLMITLAKVGDSPSAPEGDAFAGAATLQRLINRGDR
jgi:hypothetical protein